MDELSAYAQRLRRVMTGPAPADGRFAGEPPDVARVSASDLGTLLAVAWRTRHDREPAQPAAQTALAVQSATWDRSPLFSPEACLELVTALADHQAELAGEGKPVTGHHHAIAAGAVLRCTGPLPDGIARSAAALSRHAPGNHVHAWLALAALAGPALDQDVAVAVRGRLADHQLALDELAVVLAFDGIARAAVAEADRFTEPGGLARLPDVIERLAEIGEYAAFARDVLEAADARIADIHAGRVPYQADKAFTVTEADVLWRAGQVALARDELWAGEVLARLLPGVAAAPTAARTAPSQSASIVLAQAVEAWPTPEAVAALRQARRVVRHAGLDKKLDRLLRQAEKGLARRPAIALRLPGSGAPTRAQLTVLGRALEGGYVHQVSYRHDRWQAELAGHPRLGPLAARLIWEIQTTPGNWRSVLPVPAADGAADAPLADAAGDPVLAPAPEAAVRLWHPSRASAADRAAWRERVLSLRLDQPFRQAFREHYVAREADDVTTALFAGHVVAIRPLLGLAVREGWRADHLDSVLRRQAGPWRAELEVSAHLFPGASGFGDVGVLRLQASDAGRWRAARFADAPPVIASEILRWADLLVSVAGFGIEDDPALRRDDRRWKLLAQVASRPLSESARMRRATLEAVLSPAFASDVVWFTERHVRVGPYAVHLATARVTRDGEPVAVDVPRPPVAQALPWLPYDERLLEKILHIVVTLAATES